MLGEINNSQTNTPVFFFFQICRLVALPGLFYLPSFYQIYEMFDNCVIFVLASLVTTSLGKIYSFWLPAQGAFYLAPYCEVSLFFSPLVSRLAECGIS